MTRIAKTSDEPGVAEVRRWRERLLKQGGGTLKGVMNLLREAASAREAVNATSKRSRRVAKRPRRAA